MKNEFYNTFNAKSNGSVLSMYKDRDRYVEEAQNAIIDILKERGLYEQATEEEEIEEEELEQETVPDFERKVFGNHSSNIEFAKNALQGDEYFSADFSTIQKNNFRRIALVIGTLGLTSLFIFLITNEYDTDLVLYWAIPSFLLSLFLIVGIKGHQSSKSTIKLIRKNDKSVDLTIQMKEDQVTINSPFKHEYYWTYIQNVKPRIRQVNLFLLIYKDNEVLISLNETLNASKTPPPHWNYLQSEKIVPEPKFSFTNYGFQSSNLYKLQKILDGIQEEHSEN